MADRTGPGVGQLCIEDEPCPVSDDRRRCKNPSSLRTCSGKKVKDCEGGRAHSRRGQEGPNPPAETEGTGLEIYDRDPVS